MKKKPPCPVCGDQDSTAKVSALFIEGIRRSHKPSQRDSSSPNQPASPLPSIYQSMTTSDIGQLSRRLKPPDSGKKPPLRPIHPDLVLIAFSLFAPFFLYEIMRNQPNFFLPVLMILAAFYAFYFWKRKNILDKFEHQKMERLGQDERVKMAIQRWMRLYYCPQEDIIFEAGEDDAVPADQMSFYLFRNE